MDAKPTVVITIRQEGDDVRISAEFNPPLSKDVESNPLAHLLAVRALDAMKDTDDEAEYTVAE